MTTDESGNYKILSLPVGPQEIKVEKSGFKTALRLGVNLVVEQEAVVNFRLEVGASKTRSSQSQRKRPGW